MLKIGNIIKRAEDTLGEEIQSAEMIALADAIVKEVDLSLEFLLNKIVRRG